MGKISYSLSSWPYGPGAQTDSMTCYCARKSIPPTLASRCYFVYYDWNGEVALPLRESLHGESSQEGR